MEIIINVTHSDPQIRPNVIASCRMPLPRTLMSYFEEAKQLMPVGSSSPISELNPSSTPDGLSPVEKSSPRGYGSLGLLMRHVGNVAVVTAWRHSEGKVSAGHMPFPGILVFILETRLCWQCRMAHT